MGQIIGIDGTLKSTRRYDDTRPWTRNSPPLSASFSQSSSGISRAGLWARGKS